MKNILTFFLLAISLNVFAQTQTQQGGNTYTATEIDLKLQLQQQEVQSLQKEMEEQKESVKESLNRQEQYVRKIDSDVLKWITILGVLISIGVAFVGYLLNQKTEKSRREVNAEAANIRNLKKEVERLKAEIEDIKEEAHIHLKGIKDHKDKEQGLEKGRT
jgi:hypothetical protein